MFSYQNAKLVDLPAGIYLVWAEDDHQMAPPPLLGAKYCSAKGCGYDYNGRLYYWFRVLCMYEEEFRLNYRTNTIHWTRPDGTIQHGMVVGPFSARTDDEPPDRRSLHAVKTLMETEPSMDWKEWHLRQYSPLDL